MISVSEIGGIPLAYDRLHKEDYGTQQPHRSFMMAPELKLALDKFIDILGFMGWKEHIDLILSAGAYVDKPGAHKLGKGFDLDGIILNDGTIYTALKAPEKLYWQTAAVLGQIFGVLLHREYNIDHQDHFHMDLSRSVEWRNSTNQAQLVQAILVHVFNKELEIDGKIGHNSIEAWCEALGKDHINQTSDFIELMKRASIDYEV